MALIVVLAGRAGADDRVRLTAGGFEPPAVQLSVGDSVTWVNDTATERTIAAEAAVWDSGPLRPGETFTVTTREAGRLEYGTADGAHVGVLLIDVDPGPRGDGTEAAERSQTAAPAEAVPVLAETGVPLPPLLVGLLLVVAGAGLLQHAKRS